jgi:Tfp pilus assembly protein PilO
MKLLRGNLKDQLIWCRRAQWGLLAMLLVMGGGIYLLWIRPENARLDLAHQRIATAESELQQDQDRAKNLPKVELEIAGLRQRVARFDKELPRQLDLAQFINDVTRISQDASLKNLSWHLDSKARQSDQFTELPILFSFEGDFQSGVLQFLRGTEDMQRLTRVRKLDLRSDDAHDGLVKAEVTMNIYFGEE